MGKVPDRLDSGLYQALCDLRSLGLRDREGCDLHLVIDNKLFKVIDPADFHTTDHETDQPRIGIEHSLDHKSALLKICVIGDGLSKVSGSDDNEVVLSVDS